MPLATAIERLDTSGTRRKKGASGSRHSSLPGTIAPPPPSRSQRLSPNPLISTTSRLPLPVDDEVGMCGHLWQAVLGDRQHKPVVFIHASTAWAGAEEICHLPLPIRVEHGGIGMWHFSASCGACLYGNRRTEWIGSPRRPAQGSASRS